jgi:hypothetical protein
VRKREREKETGFMSFSFLNRFSFRLSVIFVLALNLTLTMTIIKSLSYRTLRYSNIKTSYLRTSSLWTAADNGYVELDIANQQRMSHSEFFRNRNWQNVQQFWIDTVRDSTNLMPFVEGDNSFGVTDLKPINRAGMRGEFNSKDLRYQRKKNFALRIGYVGTLYNGYQQQRNVEGVYTVEDDIKKSLGCIAYGAGACVRERERERT